MNRFKTNLVTAAACIASTFLFFPPASVSAAALISANTSSNFTTEVSDIIGTPIYAKMIELDRSNQWFPYPIRENVPQNKTWTINLKYPVRKASVNDSSIFVLDDQDNKVKANLALSNNGKQIKISPIANYTPDHGYLLCIVGINSGSCMPFTIDSDSVKVDESFNNKSITLKKGQTLQLTLPDEGADGGYSWEMHSFDNSVIKNTDTFDILTSFYPSHIPSEFGNNRWIFKAANTGTTSLNLEYQQSFEDSPSDTNTFKLNINVQ